MPDNEGVTAKRNPNRGKEGQTVITVPGYVNVHYIGRGFDKNGDPATHITVEPVVERD